MNDYEEKDHSNIDGGGAYGIACGVCGQQYRKRRNGKLGDMFFITVCNQKLAYEVDNIAVVEPTDIDLIRIDTQQDYVTLLTCTPYGVNTHRLLVRGHRVEMAEEAIAEVEEKVVPEGSTWIEKYAEGLVIGLIASFAAMLLLLLILLIRRRQKKKTGNIAGSERK